MAALDLRKGMEHMAMRRESDKKERRRCSGSGRGWKGIENGKENAKESERF
tara:strand:- start:360 stop:512 length:153 start_codon:yes stop_codon:yes gene_type:complete